MRAPIIASDQPVLQDSYAAYVAHLGDLDLVQEAGAQVLEHDAVRGGEEGEHVADEVLLAVVQLVPVRLISAEVHLLGCRRAEQAVVREAITARQNGVQVGRA